MLNNTPKTMEEKINEMAQTQGKCNKKVINCINFSTPSNAPRDYFVEEDQADYIDNMCDAEYMACFGDLPANQI